MGDFQREQAERILVMIADLEDEHLLMRIAKVAASKGRLLARKRIEQHEKEVWERLPVFAQGDVIYLVRRPKKGGRLAVLRDKPLIVVHVDPRYREIVVHPFGDGKTVVLNALDCERYGITMRPTPGAFATSLLGGCKERNASDD